jgi:hypothetical protein
MAFCDLDLFYFNLKVTKNLWNWPWKIEFGCNNEWKNIKSKNFSKKRGAWLTLIEQTTKNRFFPRGFLRNVQKRKPKIYPKWG